MFAGSARVGGRTAQICSLRTDAARLMSGRRMERLTQEALARLKFARRFCLLAVNKSVRKSPRSSASEMELGVQWNSAARARRAGRRYSGSYIVARRDEDEATDTRRLTVIRGARSDTVPSSSGRPRLARWPGRSLLSCVATPATSSSRTGGTRDGGTAPELLDGPLTRFDACVTLCYGARHGQGREPSERAARRPDPGAARHHRPDPQRAGTGAEHEPGRTSCH
jgi:hypothetical protein